MQEEWRASDITRLTQGIDSNDGAAPSSHIPDRAAYDAAHSAVVSDTTLVDTAQRVSDLIHAIDTMDVNETEQQEHEEKAKPGRVNHATTCRFTAAAGLARLQQLQDSRHMRVACVESAITVWRQKLRQHDDAEHVVACRPLDRPLTALTDSKPVATPKYHAAFVAALRQTRRGRYGGVWLGCDAKKETRGDVLTKLADKQKDREAGKQKKRKRMLSISGSLENAEKKKTTQVEHRILCNGDERRSVSPEAEECLPWPQTKQLRTGDPLLW